MMELASNEDAVHQIEDRGGETTPATKLALLQALQKGKKKKSSAGR